jgi:hypothetical protein
MNLNNFSKEELNDPKIKEMIQDHEICIKDGVAISSWIEDVREAPEDYPYNEYELKGFLDRISE